MGILKSIVKAYNSISLILRIAIGIVLGIVLALLFPDLGIVLLGDLFVGALKSIAPILVAVLVISSLCQNSAKLDKRFLLVIILYLLSTFLAALLAVGASFLFPQTIELATEVTEQAAPGGIGEIIRDQMLNMIDNPIRSITNANYVSILLWSVVLGLALKKVASDHTKKSLSDLSEAVSLCVRWIINLAPFGIMGLVYGTVAGKGLEVFASYGKLLALLVGCMLAMELIVSPAITVILLRTNPYPLVFRCLRESGL